MAEETMWLVWILILLLFGGAIFFIFYVMTPENSNLGSNIQGIINSREIQDCVNNLYQQKKNSGLNFSYQCLGICGDYAVDIVHVPRIDEDNLVENQCQDYLQGKIKKFIELAGNGSIVRVG